MKEELFDITKLMHFKRYSEYVLEIKIDIDSRKTEHNAARSAFISCVYNNTNAMLVDIARCLGMNHATIIHHKSKHELNYGDNFSQFGRIYRKRYDEFVDIFKSKFGESHISKKMLIGYL